MSQWETFLKEAIVDDKQVAELRLWIKELLSEGRRPDKILFLVGPSQSGKTLLLKMLSALVGEERSIDYLPKIGTVAGTAALKNKRLIILSEKQTEKIGKISATIKSLLCDDLMVRRAKHSEYETFLPDYALACANNSMDFGDDLALASRVLRVDLLPVTIPDPNLFEEMLKEVDKIKAWAARD